MARLKSCPHCGKIHKDVEHCNNKIKRKYKQTISNPTKWGKLRAQALERDLYCDQYLLYTEGRVVTDNLNVHHVRERQHYPELEWDLNNLITLSEDTHHLVHRLGSDKFIDIFEEILSKKLKPPFKK